MDVVYELKCYIDNGNDDYNFENIPYYVGNIIVRDNGFFDGIVTINVFNEMKEVLIFGNLLEGKMLNFMITGNNIVIGSTLIKTNIGFEGRALISNYIVLDDDTVNSTYNNSHNVLVSLDKKLDVSSDLVRSIRSKVDRMLESARELEKNCDDPEYINYYDYTLSNNDEALIWLEQLYIQYKSNPKALIKELV